MIKFSEQDELTYVPDLATWHHDEELHDFTYQSLDILIDSTGMIHHLNHRDKDLTFPQSTGDIIDLTRAIKLVKAHFSLMGSCCSAKLTARSVAELINLVAIEYD